MFIVYMCRIINCNIWFFLIGVSINVVELFMFYIYLFSVCEGDIGYYFFVFVFFYFDGYCLVSVILVSINNLCFF